MKSRFLLPILLLLTSEFVKADSPSSAEDAVFDRLTRTRSDPLDSLAYSILIRHMKNRHSGSTADSEPRISSYFVVDTEARKQPGRLEFPDTLSSYNDEVPAIDYPPLEYGLPKEYNSQQSELQITNPSSQGFRMQDGAFAENVESSVQNPGPQASRVKAQDFVEDFRTEIRSSPPPMQTDYFVNEFENQIRSSRPQYPEIPQTDGIVDSFDKLIQNTPSQLPQVQVDAFASNFDNKIQRTRPQRPQGQSTDSFVNIVEDKVQHSHLQPLWEQIKTFEESLSKADRNRLRNSIPQPRFGTRNENFQYFEKTEVPIRHESSTTINPRDYINTAPIIDISDYSVPPTISTPSVIRPNLRPSSPQTTATKLGSVVRSSVQLPPNLFHKTTIRPVLPFKSQILPTPAITKSYGDFSQFQTAKPVVSHPVIYKQKNIPKQVGAAGSSMSIQKAVDLLTKFSEDFVSEDNSKAPTAPTTGTPLRRPIENTIDAGGLQVVNPPFRFQAISPQGARASIRNELPVARPSRPIYFFDPQTPNYPQGNKPPTISQFHTIKMNQPPPKSANLRSNSIQNPNNKLNLSQKTQPSTQPKQPLGYEIFKSIIREMR